MLIKTGLYVITGGPGTGKTSLIEELKIVGYQTVKEVARDIIKEQQQQETHCPGKIPFYIPV